jgi:hypothetical protein
VCRVWLATALSLTLLIAPVAAPAADSAAPASATPSPRPAYLQRGDETEERYQAYRARLQRFFETLDARVAEDAPDLRPSLVPPAPVPYGYQILPRLVPDPPRRSRSRIVSGSYSWRRTESYIDGGRARLDALGLRLGEAAHLAGEARRRELEKLAGEYRRLVAGQRLIANNIEYNRLWQGEIARHPGVYDRLTGLHDAVLERQALLDALPLGDERIEADVRARVDALSRRIEGALGNLPAPDFLRVDHPSAHRWILRLPVYTDIEDSSFVDRVRAGVEQAWQVRDGEDEFALVLEMHRLSPAELYPDGGLPPRGAHIDLVDHTRRFPPGGAVLVTGGNTTHVRGRNVILGPHDVEPNVLAHEFGHILGLVDGYFRGYRDRGPDGYEVLEVVIDAGDIMSAPSQGRARRQHYQQILGEKRG